MDLKTARNPQLARHCTAGCRSTHMSDIVIHYFYAMQLAAAASAGLFTQIPGFPAALAGMQPDAAAAAAAAAAIPGATASGSVAVPMSAAHFFHLAHAATPTTSAGRHSVKGDKVGSSSQGRSSDQHNNLSAPVTTIKSTGAHATQVRFRYRIWQFCSRAVVQCISVLLCQQHGALSNAH